MRVFLFNFVINLKVHLSLHSTVDSTISLRESGPSSNLVAFKSALHEMIGGLTFHLLFSVLFHSAKEEQSSDVLARVPSRKHVCAVVDGLQVDSR